MNILDAVVTRVVGEPYQRYDRWWVEVEYDCWGRLSKTHIMCSSEGGAKEVRVGYKFHV